MYTNKPAAETEIVEFDKKELESEKRIKVLEETVRRLSEQVTKLSAAQQLNSRQIRRQNTDIHNVNTVLRNR